MKGEGKLNQALRRWWRLGAVIAFAGLGAGCAAKEKEGYQVSAQPPARYIKCERSQEDVVRHEESNCRLPAAFAGSASDYLRVITGLGHRRTGTPAARCAAAFIRNTLAFLGFRTEEVSYPFPYYEFEPEAVKVVRARDGKEFPSYPMQYSGPINGTRTGRLSRPRKNLRNCFVFVDSSLFSPRDLKAKYEQWKKQGALGIIREADLRPLAAKGLPHAARAHTTSWHYAPLPGLVVADARELVGETISVTQHARIVQGAGYSVIGQGPQRRGRDVLVTAHLDSWFEGALDDASGTAAMLETALLLKDDPQGVLFLAADSEEIGLIGSAAYVQKYGVENVGAVLELDMVSVKYSYGRARPERERTMPRVFSMSPGLFPLTRKIYGPLGGPDLYFSVRFSRSLTGMLGTDYEWFYSAGIPGLFIYTPSKYYHTARDTLEWIPPADLQAVAEASAEMVRWLRDNLAVLKPPAEVIPFSFTARLAAGDTVEFSVRPARKPGAVPVKVQVRCYFEQGYEDKVDLKGGADGVFRGFYRLPWPGEWQFLANLSQGGKFGKRWQAVNAPAKEDRCARSHGGGRGNKGGK